MSLKMKKDLAVCVVADFKYLYRYFYSFKRDLQLNGNYFGEILIITSLLSPTFLLPSTYSSKVKILRKKKIKLSRSTINILNSNDTKGQPNRNINKKFQWHKINLFDTSVKNWNYIFYLDINMKIHNDISGILSIKPNNKIFARADSYPEYKNNLSSQFDKNTESYIKLKEKYDLTINNYFQTGLLYFDTNIVNTKTKERLIELSEQYPCTITNEQAICNLYFIFEENLYEELVAEINNEISYFYWMLPDKKVIITKQNRIQYK